MVTDKNENSEKIWQHIRTIRKSGNVSKNYVLAPLEQISQNFQKLSTALNFTKASDEILDLPEASINAAAKMFLYLNSIPQIDSHRNWIDLFNTIISRVDFGISQARPAAATILSVLKILRKYKSEDDRIIANKLMKKLASLYNFKYYHPDRASQSNQTNILNVHGEYHLKT